MWPLIGITTYLTPARWSYWDLEAALVPADYVRAVERSGGRALLVPPFARAVSETLDALDGLILTGGADLDPSLYGEEPHPETFAVEAMRDEAEVALLGAALERDVPVLGICRGSQLLNVALGGDLHQHLPEFLGHERHKHDPPGVFVAHEVATEPGTRLASLLGERASVHSHHHQGFRRLGSGLVGAARAEDGSLEAIEAATKQFVLGVLWHPEAGSDARLFETLVEEARVYRREKALGQART